MTPASPSSGPLKPGSLREAIASSIAREVKSYDVAEFCEGLGLRAQGPDEDPFRSKAIYVRARLHRLGLAELLDLARRVLTEWDDDELQALVARAGATGVAGELKNLVFASTGPKPEIVLRDALNNAIEITKGAESCLIYDEVLPEEGLTWSALVQWWAGKLRETNLDLTQRHLYKRLFSSLGSPPEELLFRTYAERFGTDPTAPALLPQVYLHYDPYLRPPGRRRPAPVIRQRMDFLLLLPQRRRVVLEVDGKHHYATPDGRADPARYAEMVAEDRRLRLAGYEVFRFGGAELTANMDCAKTTLSTFFTNLLDDPPPDHL